MEHESGVTAEAGLVLRLIERHSDFFLPIRNSGRELQVQLQQQLFSIVATAAKPANPS